MKLLVTVLSFFLYFNLKAQTIQIGKSCQQLGYKMLDTFNALDTSAFSHDSSFFYKSFIDNNKILSTISFKIDSIVNKKFNGVNATWFYTKAHPEQEKYIFILSETPDYISVDQFFFYRDVTVIRSQYLVFCK